MKKRALTLITNAHARRGGARGRAQAVARFCERLRERGEAVEVRATEAAGDAARLAAEAARAGAPIVIAAGGDGTINETLQGLVGTDARLAIWPAGTANVLAREITMPFEAERAADVIAAKNFRRVHLGRATLEASGERRYFLLMAGVGLDASVVRGVRPELKRRVGEAAFWYSGLEHLAFWQPKHFTLEIDGRRVSATFAAIGKSAHYGGGLAITPRARLDLAEFEICAVDSASRLQYLRLLADVLRGAHEANEVCFHRATRVRASSPDGADESLFVQVDGELIGTLPMTFEVAPETIDLVVPSEG